MPTVSIGVCEPSLIYLGDRAKGNANRLGHLLVKHTDGTNSKWLKRFFCLYENLLFEFQGSESNRPLQVVFLEHCQCERVVMKNIQDVDHQFCFRIIIPCQDRSAQIILCKAEQEQECSQWINAIRTACYASLQLQREELEHKYSHVIQILESERAEKFQLLQQCDEQTKELEALRQEVTTLRKAKGTQVGKDMEDEEKSEIAQKVQSVFRGLICRKRWRSIVQDYIRSPHAESMRKRNQLVFELVRSEEEYLQCLSTLVSAFFRPLKMAASSKKPSLTHEEVNSIFLNCETLMFLHQIFLKGLQTRMESWPTLVLGDLFDMLLPMLSIYQEYVRNHHYSLQTLADCKQRESFRRILRMYEERQICEGRNLETYLTYPMHRIPSYIIILHQLVALTPADHVERKSLEHAQSVLEELSNVMHDEVSETENIRKNLSIERQFSDGCEILLDVNQIFIRQGSLLQINGNDSMPRRRSFSTLSLKLHDRKDSVRQCFLFSRVLLLTSRGSNGKLILSHKGRIPLQNATVTEDVVDEDIELLSVPYSSEYGNLAFKIVVNNGEDSQPHKIFLLASSNEDKTAWTSDISQCIENLKAPDYGDLVSIASRQSLLSLRSDSKLFQDDVDIKYSKALDSCRLPRIRHGSIDRLMERLLDVRFLSVEFLNTFLTTYSLFTDAHYIVEMLMQFYYSREYQMTSTSNTSENISPEGPKMHRQSLPTGVLGSISRSESPWGSSSCFSYAGISGSRSPSSLKPPTFSAIRRHSSPSALADEDHVFKFGGGDDSSEKYDESSYQSLSRKGNKQRANSETTPIEPDISRPCPASSDRSIDFQGQTGSNRVTVLFSGDSSLTLSNLSSINEDLFDRPVCTPSDDEGGMRIIKLESPPRLRRRIRSGSNTDAELTTSSSIDQHSVFLEEDSPLAQVPENKEDNASGEEWHFTGRSTPGEQREEIKIEYDSCSNDGTQMKKISTDSDAGEPMMEQSITVSRTPDGKIETQFDAVLSPMTPETPRSPHDLSSEWEIESRNSSVESDLSVTRQISQSHSDNGCLSLTRSRSDSQTKGRKPRKTTRHMSIVTSEGMSFPLEIPQTLKIPLPANSAPPSPARWTKTNAFEYPNTLENALLTPRDAGSRSPINSAPASPKRGKKPPFRFGSGDDGSSPFDISRNQRIRSPANSSPSSPAPGVIITSHRASKRRSSITSAAIAFAAATAGASVSPAASPTTRFRFGFRFKFQDNVDGHLVTKRVLKVLKYWISKQAVDFTSDVELREKTKGFLRDIKESEDSVPSERKTAQNILNLLESETKSREDTTSIISSLENMGLQTTTKATILFERISTLQMAEQLTNLEHEYLAQIPSKEFLDTAWMKTDKERTAPNILKVINLFNQISRLVATEIVTKGTASSRASAIEKWAAVADNCRCMHNFNAVLEIITAFTSSSVFRLRKTWEKLSKQTRILIEKLQSIVSADARFRSMREALKSCDPPCVPYLGFYLTDLAFIEEGTKNLNQEGLVNFSKMRMISNVIQEIRSYQQVHYKVTPDEKILEYILCKDNLLDDDELYNLSLTAEPRRRSNSGGKTQRFSFGFNLS